MDTIVEIARALKALQIAQRSGSPSRLRITWRKMKNPRTLATLAARAEQRQERQPERRVQSILEQLISRTEGK